MPCFLQGFWKKRRERLRITLPESNGLPMKIPIFPGKYHQNGRFSMGYVSLPEGIHAEIKVNIHRKDSPSGSYLEDGAPLSK